MHNTTLAIREAIPIRLKDRLARNMIMKLMQQVEHGHIIIDDPMSTIHCGNPSSDTPVHLTINNLEFYSLVFFKGSIGFAIAFMNNYLETDNLTKLLFIFAKNLSTVKKSESNVASIFFQIFETLGYIYRPNTIFNSKQRILAHYDLSNQLFELFLDKSMSYSSLMFRSNNDSLEEAAHYKNCNLLARLQLKRDDHLLEIGTGWGGLAITAASQYHCQVTTTTISNNQFEYAKSKIHSLGLQDRIKLLNKDYRHLTGKFNKLISVEMIEAVGYQYLPEYFKVCSNLLLDDGIFALQCITIRDQEYERAKREVDFIKKFIFPGGCLPSMQKIINCVAKHTNLSLISCEDITHDYAITLQRWRDNFLNRRQEIYKLGFDTYFMKMWEYYFSYCEAGFLNRNIMCLQLVFAKPGYIESRPNAQDH